MELPPTYRAVVVVSVVAAALAACDNKKKAPPASSPVAAEHGERPPRLSTMPYPGRNLIAIDVNDRATWTPAGCEHPKTIEAMLDVAADGGFTGTVQGAGADQTVAARVTTEDHFTLELRGRLRLDAAMYATIGRIGGEADRVIATAPDGATCEAAGVRIDLRAALGSCVTAGVYRLGPAKPGCMKPIDLRIEPNGTDDLTIRAVDGAEPIDPRIPTRPFRVVGNCRINVKLDDAEIDLQLDGRRPPSEALSLAQGSCTADSIPLQWQRIAD